MSERIERLSEEAECPICMDHVAGTALACGHCFCCSDACFSSRMEVCPTCGKSAATKTKLFGAVGPLGSLESMIAGADAGAHAAGKAARAAGGISAAETYTVAADAGAAGREVRDAGTCTVRRKRWELTVEERMLHDLRFCRTGQGRVKVSNADPSTFPIQRVLCSVHSSQRLREVIMAPSPGTSFVPRMAGACPGEHGYSCGHRFSQHHHVLS